MDVKQTSYSSFLGRSTSTLTLSSISVTPVHSTVVYRTRTTTIGYNRQCKNYIDTLGVKKAEFQSKINEKLATDPNYTGARQNGVSLAWEYEKADIEMGGRGSNNWNESEQQDILSRGTVRGAEGHHQKNVADHPEYQADPDNIKFYRSKKEHLQKGHDGDWKNESDAPKIDKEEMLKNTNRKRVFKNELRGAGLAALIGFATGASIGFIVSLAQNGISPESIKGALKDGGIFGVEGAALSIVSYGISRLVGGIATSALTGVLTKLGIDVTENIAKACNIGAVGSIVIIATSIYSYIKLRQQGMSVNDSLSCLGKQMVISVASLAVTVIVQSVYGGPASIAVGVGISAIMLSYSMYNIYHNKVLADRIQVYSIEKTFKSLSYGL